MGCKANRRAGRCVWPATFELLSVGQARTPLRSILKIITKSDSLPPIHPGEVLREDVLPETGLSVSAAAKALGVSRQMLHEILAERKPLSAVMCLKVSRLFGSSPEMWIGLQATYDLKKAARDKKVMERVARIVPLTM
jgi:antitoxin HigA-1